MTAAQLLLNALAAASTATGPELLRATGLPRETVKKALRRLELRGAVEVVGQIGRANRYALTSPNGDILPVLTPRCSLPSATLPARTAWPPPPRYVITCRRTPPTGRSAYAGREWNG